MRRGDVVVIADRSGGDYGRKPRPALVVQSDLFDGTQSVVVCPITSQDKASDLLRVPLAPSPGLLLRGRSWVMVDKLMSLRRDRATQGLGRVSEEEMIAVNRSLATFLAFG